MDEIYAKFKSLESKDDIAWIRVILHDDTEIIESEDGEEMALYGDSQKLPLFKNRVGLIGNKMN